MLNLCNRPKSKGMQQASANSKKNQAALEVTACWGEEPQLFAYWNLIAPKVPARLLLGPAVKKSSLVGPLEPVPSPKSMAQS
jgi:hypothetical protein